MARAGFSMIEVLVAVACFGAAVGGVAQVAVQAARAERETALAMQARWAALETLDLGVPGEHPMEAEYRSGPGWAEARVVWNRGGRPGEVRLACGRVHE
jgi:prepilin-type N-terminal cleavage/methylation domain-containing protein